MKSSSHKAEKEFSDALSTCSYVRAIRLLNEGLSPNVRQPGFVDTYPGRPGEPLKRSNLTALHYAAFWRAKKSQLPFLRHLLDAGADVHAADSQGYPPCTTACTTTSPSRCKCCWTPAPR